jgi:hypothetical protein
MFCLTAQYIFLTFVFICKPLFHSMNAFVALNTKPSLITSFLCSEAREKSEPKSLLNTIQERVKNFYDCAMVKCSLCASATPIPTDHPIIQHLASQIYSHRLLFFHSTPLPPHVHAFNCNGPASILYFTSPPFAWFFVLPYALVSNFELIASRLFVV